MTMEKLKVLGTVDLGSNSFHLRIDKLYPHGRIQCVLRQKEKVQLRSGLTPDDTLSEAAQTRALECLRVFAASMKAHQVTHSKIIGTYTLRAAKDLDHFLKTAEDILGTPIEIISGEEEARLIYLGATLKSKDQIPQLVVDIGGGSTELILGHGKRLDYGVSFPMGCVSFQERFFPEGFLDLASFESGIHAAKQLILKDADLRHAQFQRVLGSSGTLQALCHIVHGLGDTYGTIKRTQLHDIITHLIGMHSVSNIRFEGLRADRESVLAGGLCIIIGIFEALHIQTLKLSEGGVREGMLAELIATLRHTPPKRTP